MHLLSLIGWSATARAGGQIVGSAADPFGGLVVVSPREKFGVGLFRHCDGFSSFLTGEKSFLNGVQLRSANHLSAFRFIASGNSLGLRKFAGAT